MLTNILIKHTLVRCQRRDNNNTTVDEEQQYYLNGNYYASVDLTSGDNANNYGRWII